MKNLSTILLEKLKINKDTKLNNELMNYIFKVSGIGDKFDNMNLFYDTIHTWLEYRYKIEDKSDLEIYCNSKSDFIKRIVELRVSLSDIDFNDSKNDYGSINFNEPNIIERLNWHSGDIILNKYPFKIYAVNNGILIQYQHYRDKYLMYFKKKIKNN